jgi:hypothetical protein
MHVDNRPPGRSLPYHLSPVPCHFSAFRTGVFDLTTNGLPCIISSGLNAPQLPDGKRKATRGPLWEIQNGEEKGT